MHYSQTHAAQDFRHIPQADNEKVANFIWRLEHTFSVAYGREGKLEEARVNLRLGQQLQDGMKHELLNVAAVSGVQSYRELCLTAWNEENWFPEFKKRLQYLKPSSTQLQAAKWFPESKPFMPPANKSTSQEPRKHFLCQNPGHLAQECRLREPLQLSGVVTPRRLTLARNKWCQLESLQDFLYSGWRDYSRGADGQGCWGGE
jgi:hypothetical protein